MSLLKRAFLLQRMSFLQKKSTFQRELLIHPGGVNFDGKQAETNILFKGKFFFENQMFFKRKVPFYSEQGYFVLKLVNGNSY